VATNVTRIKVVVDNKDVIRAMDQLNRSFEKFANNVEESTKKGSQGLRQLGNQTEKASRGFIDLKTAVSTAAGFLIAEFAGTALRAVRDGVLGTVDNFRKFELGLTGVQKTTGITGAELQNLGKDVTKLSRTIPVATDELFEIAESAGQLGVKGSANILLFSETIAKLGRTTNVEGQEAAVQLTRVLNITKEGIGTIDKFASVIVRLGNNFAASEQEIIKVTNEIARGTAIFGLGSTEAAALATSLRSLGLRAELAGSVTQRAFQAIDTAIQGGGPALESLTRLTGLTGRLMEKL